MNRLKLTAFFTVSALLFSLNSANSVNSLNDKTLSIQVSKTSSQIDGLIDQGKFDEAKTIADDLLKKNPDDAGGRVVLGDIYSAQYKLEAAQREFLRVLDKDPSNAAAHNGLGMIYYLKTASSNMDIRKNTDKLYESAIDEFQTAIKLSPNCYRAYNNAGKIYQESGKLNEAEKYFRKAIEIEPKYSKAIENLGSVLFSKNQVNAAIENYKEAIEVNSKNSSAYYHLGEALIAKGDYSKAINYLQTSLYLFPNSAPVHDMLGKAYEMQGNEAAAISEYKKAELIKPEYVAPTLRLANIYQNRGDYEYAIAELKTALSSNPDFMEGKLKIAEISLNSGKTDQAIKYYKELVNNKNYSAPALKGLSKAYFLKAQEVNTYANLVSESEYVEAEDAIRQALQYNPNDLQLYLALLRITKLSNDDSQADYYLSKVVNSSSNKSIDHVIKGEAYLTLNDFNNARSEFRKALESTNRVDDLLNLGDIYIVNKQYQSAKEVFNRVLSLSPGNAKAFRSLERIRTNENQAVAKFNIAKAFYDENQTNAAIQAFRDCLSINPALVEAQIFLAKSFEKEKYYYNAIEHYNAYISLASLSPKELERLNRKVKSLNARVQSLQSKGKNVKKFTII